ncbi:MAG: cobalamin-dependent protein [Ignavibacteriales bacterium]|nr:cobalamin-dependent protein [Ignavibacteriales bacterium]
MNDSLNLISKKLEENKKTISQNVLDEHFELAPAFKNSYTQRHIDLYLQDCDFKISYLAQAVRLSQPSLFVEYMRWAKIFFTSLNIVNDEFYRFFDLLRKNMGGLLTESEFEVTAKIFDLGVSTFRESVITEFSYIDNQNPLKDQADEYLGFLLNGDRRSAMNTVMSLYHSGTPIKDIYLNLFQPIMLETGLLWQTGKITVAHEHFVTAATQLIMSQLYPFLFNFNNSTNKNIVVSCVANELHEIGARMVADFFEMEGWDSYYYGANTPVDSVLRALENHNAQVLAISATMTYHLKDVENFISKVKHTPDFENVKIIVGGYPFKIAKNLWKDIGADGFAEDAAGAISLANGFILN